MAWHDRRSRVYEPAIIDITSYDDVTQAIEDDRLDKTIDEHTRYMKETNREIWAL